MGHVHCVYASTLSDNHHPHDPETTGNVTVCQFKKIVLFLLGVLLGRRYLKLIASRREVEIALPKLQYLLLPFILPLDLFSRLYAMYDLCLPSRRNRW